MSDNVSDEVEINFRRLRADQSGSLEPELESSRADDTRSTVEMKAEEAPPVSNDENLDRIHEELQTLLDPPAERAGANSRRAPVILLQRLLERIDDLENQVKPKPFKEIQPEVSQQVKREFHRMDHDDHHSLSPSLIDDDEYSRQIVEDALPKDKARFKSNKTTEQTCKTFFDLLKNTNISKGDSNWSTWEGYFGSIVDVLELRYWVYQDVPTPLTMQDLLVIHAGNDARAFESQVLPDLYRDIFGKVSVRNHDLEGVEIMHEEEKRRFDAAMMYLFSILVTCTSNANLKGILDKNGASIRKDVPAMFKNLRDHFVMKTGSSITQKFLSITSIAHFDKSDKNSARAIGILRDNKRALEGQGIVCPDIFYVSILLGTLDPDSAIKDRLGLIINEKGDNVNLENMIGFCQTWFRDKDIQSRNDRAVGSLRVSKGNKSLTLPTNKLSVNEQKQFRECTRQGICYHCFTAGTKDQAYKDCSKHFKKKSEQKVTESKDKVKSKKAKVVHSSDDCDDDKSVSVRLEGDFDSVHVVDGSTDEESGSDLMDTECELVVGEFVCDLVEGDTVSDQVADDSSDEDSVPDLVEPVSSDDESVPDLVDDESTDDDSDSESNAQGDVVNLLSCRYDTDDEDDYNDVPMESVSRPTSGGAKRPFVSSKVSKCTKGKFVKNKEARNRSSLNTTHSNILASKCFDLLDEATKAVSGIAEQVDFFPLCEHGDFVGINRVVKRKEFDSFLIDSGAAYSTVPSADSLSKVQRLKRILNLEYADGSKGTQIDHQGSLFLNGHELRTLVSPDLKEGLLSTSQMDRELKATTVQTDGRSITFVPDARQEQVLDMLLEEMKPENVVADASLNEDGLYEVRYTRDNKRTLSVTVFPRVAANTLTQAVYLLHASLGHMPQDSLVALAKDAAEEKSNSSMVVGWPSVVTPDVINTHYPSCKACMQANQKKLPFFHVRSNEPSKSKPTSTVVKVGQLGQVDMWGPYPAGRLGNTHIFTVIDAYSQYAVSLPCTNRPGEIPKLLKAVLGTFQSLGVFFEKIVGDSAFNTASCRHVLHTAYGQKQGIQFSLAIPEEHETCGIIERYFSTLQRRAAANALAFLENEDHTLRFLGLDAMTFAANSLNWTPRRKFDMRGTPASVIGRPPLNLHETLLLPFGISAIAHQKRRSSKLHGHGSDCIYLGPSENSSHRGGLFFSRATSEVSVRRSHNHWVDRPFFDFIVKDGLVSTTFEEILEEEIDDPQEPPSLLAEPSSPNGETTQSFEDMDPASASDDDDDDILEEVDSTMYHFEDIPTRSLPKKKRRLLKNLKGKNYLEYDDNGNVIFVWTIDGYSRVPEQETFFLRYYDSSLPKPTDADSFEYTIEDEFLSWAIPEDSEQAGSTSEGDPNALEIDEAIPAQVDDESTDQRPRRSSRLIASSTIVPIKAAVMQHKRLLHVLHKHVPLKLTKRRRDGSIVLVSKAKMIQKLQHSITPSSMKKALNGPDSSFWKAARDAEHKSLEENKTFRYIDRTDVPPGAKILKSLYVLKLALHADGSVKKHKVRLVARGDLQDPSTYSETYASTCQRKAVMLLLAIANRKDWEIASGDISTAFLYGDLDEPIYMELPDGRVVQLLKSLYGLKQAAFKFKEHLHNALTEIGFVQLLTDSSVYRLSGKYNVLLTCHVDDLLFISPNLDDIRWAYERLSKSYSMTFTEVANEYLGYNITRKREARTLKLDQFGTITKLLTTFPPQSFSKVLRTPYHRKTKNFTEAEEALLPEREKSLFQQMTGSLLYLAICTRGDLLYAVHLLTRRMASPRTIDLQRAKRCIEYVSQTARHGVTFHGNDTEEIFGWADSSFNSGEGDRKNCYGYCFQLGKKSGMFVNACKRSTLIALSSTEAEFYCLAEACRELLWIKAFLSEINVAIPIGKIYQDNTTTISMADVDGLSERSKHIDVKFHFVKRLRKNGIAEFVYSQTENMVPDIFTKDLADAPFESHSVSVLGLDE